MFRSLGANITIASNAIIAIDKEYRIFTGNSSELQIKEIRKGSFEVEFVSIAIPSLFVAINNANSVFEFCNYIKNAWNCLISPTPNSIEQNKLTEKTINNCYEISKPIINNSGTINIICNNENVAFVDNVDNEKWVKVNVTADQIYVNPVAIEEGKVPDMKGMNATDAVSLLESMGWRVTFSGYGRVKSQSVKAGSELRKGSVINLVLSAK